jgi:branched-chain amino acid transport system substrate-binding protein
MDGFGSWPLSFRPVPALIALGLLLAACTPAAPAPAPAAAPAAADAGASPAAASQPIRIGVPLSATGVFSPAGIHQRAGVEVALKQMGGQAAGRPLELIYVDEESLPEPGLRVTRSLVERDNVDAIVGYVNNATGYATRDYLHQNRKPTITMAASAGLTRENKSPYIFRMIPSTFQMGDAEARYLKDKLGIKRIIYWGQDYASAREIIRAVKPIYGDDLVQEIWTPLNTSDYAPYLATIQPGAADLVTLAAWGADAVRITDQYHRAGLRERMPLFGYGNFTGEDVLSGFIPEAISGAQHGYVYCSALDNPANQEFTALFKERTGGLPGNYAYAAYLSTRMMGRAIELVNGDVSDPDRLAEAIGRATLENTPTGNHSFDANHGWVTDFFWVRVELENGQPVNKCVDRIPQVADPVREFPTAAP